MSNRYSLTKSILLFVVVWGWMGLLQSPVAQAKIYKWKDENGKVHFTDSLSTIPPQYRQGRGLETLKEVPGTSGEALKLHLPVKKSKEHVIPLRRQGNNFIVTVLLNGKVPAELLVDTGASSITLSPGIAKRLGIRNQSGLPQQTFSTAGGNMQAPLFVLKKVKVGGAEARDVEANINPHAGGIDFDGLLGMTFLGNYKVEIRMDTSEMVLRPLHERGERLWGGYSGAWWKGKFARYTRQIRQYELLKGRLKGDPVETPKINKMVRHYQGLHQSLDKRANRVNLPNEFRSYP